MKPTRLTDLIRKVRSGTATPEEKERLEQYWNHATEDESFLQSLSSAEKDRLGNHMYQAIRQEIENQEVNSFSKRIIALGNSKMYWAAASIILLLVVGSVFWWVNRNAMHTEQTLFGVRKQVVLPDQSVVMLNGNSSIRYAASWQPDQPREVWVEGEAYFAVTHTKNHQKFIVHTPDQLQIEVLGTKFNVNNRRGVTRVVLQEGKVKVSGKAETYIMTPGEMVSYSEKKLALQPQKVNPKLATSWKDHLLLFQDESLESIANKLQDSYGIRIEFANDSLKGEVFSGSVPADSIEILFDKFEKLYQIQVDKQNNRYVIQ